MTITPTEDGICVELHGREQFWALRAKISIPTDTITSIEFAPVFQDWRKWEVRMPGTSAPGKLLAGSFWTEEGWDFLYAYRPVGFVKPKLADVMVITTTDERYRRIILSTNESQAAGIIKWWNQTKTNPKPRRKTQKRKNS